MPEKATPRKVTPQTGAPDTRATKAGAAETRAGADTTGADGTGADRTGADRTGTAETGGAPAAAPERPRRRQARGERRIAQLLEAAAAVFCKSGYTGASTNAIAREAGVSPGTLYQFFPNKEAIAVSLSDQLLREWTESHGQALAPENIALPLDRMLDAVLDPIIAFNVENPAFAVLMHSTDTPGQITRNTETLHDTVLTRVEEIVAGFLPTTPPVERSVTANMVVGIFKAGIDLILTHEGMEREAYITELKTAMHRYLLPLLEEDETEA
ncbi:TetR/AcrR family transcriptional regulator [Streptomyces cavernae]|uniref:TetR/AcrR family transcriptional regulator n=1 Tax=Streptomyces cavernae TaxID=2259034 RepID=UPI000FEB9F1E|nr:TetR/AcrR family transcriptional regulator [Streptomyces cavernae]